MRLFVVLMVLATAAPWLLLPLFGTGSGASSLDLRRLAYGVGLSHVISTGALYFDPGIRPLFLAHKRRFVTLPIVVLGITPLFFWLAPARAVAYVLVAAVAWTTWHYSRQNVGVLCFLFSARGVAPPSEHERRLLLAVGAVGSAGVVAYAIALRGTGLEWAAPALREVAGFGMVLVAVVAVPVAWARRCDLVCCLFFVESIVFFAPIFFMSQVGAYPYVAAHALQYLVFMAFLVKYRPQGRRAPNWGLVVAALAIAVGGGLALRGMQESGAVVLLGVVTAVSAIHFVMDATIWRLREPTQRAYAHDRFPFLQR